jgi:hypothetical protein
MYVCLRSRAQLTPACAFAHTCLLGCMGMLGTPGIAWGIPRFLGLWAWSGVLLQDTTRWHTCTAFTMSGKCQVALSFQTGLCRTGVSCSKAAFFSVALRSAVAPSTTCGQSLGTFAPYE